MTQDRKLPHNCLLKLLSSKPRTNEEFLLTSFINNVDVHAMNTGKYKILATVSTTAQNTGFHIKAKSGRSPGLSE